MSTCRTSFVAATVFIHKKLLYSATPPKFSSMTSILDQVLSAYPKKGAVKILNPTKVAEKVNVLADLGAHALQVITDFDATLTRYHLDGKKCDSSYGIIANTSLVPEEYRVHAMNLYLKYFPIENDPNMSIEEKIPHMVEWYLKSHEYMVTAQPRIQRSSIQEMVRGSRAFLRDNAKEMVEMLAEAKVPVLVLSAGVGDVVQEVLCHNNINLPNVKVISNFMEFDEAEQVKGFKEPLIHMYNKNEAALHGDNTPYFQELKHRHNVILLGDSLGDANMDHGVTNAKCVLKIGFLNGHGEVEEHLDSYMTAFDIVLVDDQSMDFVNLILKSVLKNN